MDPSRIYPIAGTIPILHRRPPGNIRFGNGSHCRRGPLNFIGPKTTVFGSEIVESGSETVVFGSFLNQG